MALEEQVIPIHFGSGINTRTDPKLVPPGKLLRLENGVFTRPNQVEKRPGTANITNVILGGGTLVDPQMVDTFKDELVCADSGNLYAYSPTEAAWVLKGVYQPSKVSKTIVSRYYKDGLPPTSSSAAYLGNIAVFTWVYFNGASAVNLLSVVDLDTGVTLLSNYIIPNTGTTSIFYGPVAVVIGGTTLGVVYYATSNIPTLITITTSGAAVTIGTPVALSADTAAGGIDVVATPTGAAICYGTATGGSKIKIVTFNAAGAVSSANIATAVTAAGTTRIMYESATSRYWVYWLENGAHDIYYAVWSSALATVLGKTLIVATGAGILPAFEIAQGASGTQTVYYSKQDTTTAALLVTLLYPTNKITVTSAGTVGSPSLFINNLVLASKVFTLGGVQYVGMAFLSTTQGTYFAVKLSDASVFAKMLPGSAPQAQLSIRIPTSFPLEISSTRVLIPVLEQYQAGTITKYIGISYATLDLADKDLYQGVEVNSNLVLNGGQIVSYDGTYVTETGFHLSPAVGTQVNPVGGTMPAGTYQVSVIYQFVDNQGNIYESAPSPGADITVTGSTNAIEIYVATLTVTSKAIVNILVFITDTDGEEFYYGASLLNDKTVTTVTTTYTGNPTLRTTKVPLYTTGGVLDNDAPPAGVIMTAHNNRLWLVPSEILNTIWYSKSLVSAAGVNFSGNLTAAIDAKGGEITGLASMDDKLVVFEENIPFILSGDGPNDTGQNSSLSLPQPVPADASCSASKSIIVYPYGCIFKSPKGLYLLDRSLTVKYFGTDVQDYNAQAITSATLMPTKNQIRFLTESGSTLVYDYQADQWGTFTGYEGSSGTVWNSLYVFAGTAGYVRKETPGVYLDGATGFKLLIQTAWATAAGVQGLERFKQFLLLGTYTNGSSAGHGLQTTLMYDFQAETTATDPYYFTSGENPFQYRTFLPRQKCDSVSMLIEEIVTNDSAEYVTFTDMTATVAAKKGANKKAAAVSVG